MEEPWLRGAGRVPEAVDKIVRETGTGLTDEARVAGVRALCGGCFVTVHFSPVEGVAATATLFPVMG